jgi:hypothetical protein
VFGGPASLITVGNGNDTIHVGQNDGVFVGTGDDNFIFDQTTAGNIGQSAITGFDPNKDVIVLQQKLATDFSHLTFSEAIHGGKLIGTLIAIQGDSSDSILLVGVAPSALHESDFHFV